MVGRIETYIHSDNITPNKGGVLIYVKCDTDFAARTPEFIEFSEMAAKRVYGADALSWEDTIAVFPDMEERRIELQKKIRETVAVEAIQILKL
jgi:translation elongation factor EF-Ts